MDPITGSPKIDTTLSILGALVPLFSALASFVNHLVRVRTASGQQPSGPLLAAGAAINLVSMNIDKGVQFVRMAQGKGVPQTVVPPPPSDSSPVVPQ